MTGITQADKDAAARLNGYASWELWLTVPQHDKDWMQLCAEDFARHRQQAIEALQADNARLLEVLRKTVKYANAYATGTGALFDTAMSEAQAAL